MTSFHNRNSFNSFENNNNDNKNDSTDVAQKLEDNDDDDNKIIENNINDIILNDTKNLKYYKKSFINTFLNEDFDKKISYSNIKWDENSFRNFDSNNELINLLKSEKNLNLNLKSKGNFNFKKQNSISTFNYNLEENKNQISHKCKNEDKEICLFNESSSFLPSRNTSNFDKILMFSDENYNIKFNNEKLENCKEKSNCNSLRSCSFEKMVYKKFSTNEEIKNKTLNKNEINKNLIKEKFGKKNFDRKIYKGSNQSNNNNNKNNNINNIINNTKSNKANYQKENLIEKYFQKKHLREMQKLDSLRQEKIKKEIYEIKDRPSISDTSKKIYAEKIQEKQNCKSVFDRLLAPNQVI
jgi:hypothetical protein